jgi:hypothetical protein
MLPPNATTHFAGQISHQTSAAMRGPNRIKAVIKQHIANLLQDNNIPWVKKFHGGSK